jgi:hypothetical protein
VRAADVVHHAAALAAARRGGAVLGVAVLREPLTAFTVARGVLIALGLWVTVAGGE